MPGFKMKNMSILVLAFFISALQLTFAGKPKELNVRTYAANDIEAKIVSAETEMLLIGSENANGGDVFSECKDINIGSSTSDPYDVSAGMDTSTTIVIKGIVVNQCR